MIHPLLTGATCRYVRGIVRADRYQSVIGRVPRLRIPQCIEAQTLRDATDVTPLASAPWISVITISRMLSNLRGNLGNERLVGCIIVRSLV